MQKINILSKEIIDKIAAGEVIERPVSVVRELVDNAIDARSKNIRVDVKNSGMKRIAVIDDGEGMNEDNLQKCYLPHATSKIISEDDLLRIASFGFRGEALSSVSVVSRMSIKSKIAENDFGKMISLDNGEVDNFSSVGMPNGTEVVVEDLFYNLPARKKFLKNLNIESRQIVEALIKMALMFPEIGFSHYHNDKEIFKFSSGQNLNERTELIFGKETYNNLLPINVENKHFKLRGFLGKPQIANRALNRQHIFVNNRPIKNNTIANIVKDSYGNFLDPKNHPMFILFFDFPPENIDVNIHPRKQEIKFFDQINVHKALKEGISEELNKSNLSYLMDDFDGLMDDGMEEYTAGVLKSNTDLWQVRDSDREAEILQIHKTFLVQETQRGMLLIDQHAAHERILFEELLDKFNKMKDDQKIYELEEAIIFDLPLADVKLLNDNIDTFKQLGFDIEYFGGTTFKINAILDIFKNRNILELFMEYLGDLQNGLDEFKLDTKTEKTIAYLACRAAIKAGDYLTQEERRRILDKLKETKSNYTCPHGRPVHIEITGTELQTMFKRI